MSTGARWLADERLGRHDLGERTTSTQPSAYSGGKDGDPATTAPLVLYPLVERLDPESRVVWWMILQDAGLVH